MNVKNCAKINLALLLDRIDTQNAFTAMKMFNYNAERWISQKGYNETAQFIKLVCIRRGYICVTFRDRHRNNKIPQDVQQCYFFFSMPMFFPDQDIDLIQNCCQNI